MIYKCIKNNCALHSRNEISDWSEHFTIGKNYKIIKIEDERNLTNTWRLYHVISDRDSQLAITDRMISQMFVDIRSLNLLTLLCEK
jgi:hypothetical protein